MSAESSHAPAPKRASGVVVPQPLKWHGRIASILIYALVRVLSVTVRFRWSERSAPFGEDPSQRVIFCIWHNRLALSVPLYRRYVQQRAPERRMACLISASRDGGILAHVIELFDLKPVRGSSSRRGAQAMLELTSLAKDGYDISITPDGPRGPCYSVQDGIIATAQFTGLPIIPTSYFLNWKYRLKSWDKFQIPFPFTCCDVIVGEPITVPRDVSDEERAKIKERLQAAMMEITRD